MQGERARGNVLLGHDIAAEDIKNHVQMKAGPLDRAFDLGDIPAPDLVGPGGEQASAALRMRVRSALSVSPWGDAFVLKGALLFDLWFDQLHRPTRDMDLLGFGSAEIADVAAVGVGRVSGDATTSV